MKIIRNADTQSFIQRCHANMSDSSKNMYLGMHITEKNEHAIQKRMQKDGFAEFQQEPSLWPSLFIDADVWENSPYHSHIHLDQISDSSFRYETELLQDHELFNADEIQPDPLHELNDSMILRALNRPCSAVLLYQNDEVWMIDSPSESATNDRAASKAHGNVLTFGLGIGYFIYMCLENPAVTSITAVEYSEATIEMFRKEILPQFPASVPIHIIHKDAFDCYNDAFLSRYDYVYTDIWQSSTDGLLQIEKLLMQSNLPLDKADFWIENSCMETMWALMMLTFEEIMTEKEINVSLQYKPLMQKIHCWVDSISDTVDSSEQLKFWMYDRSTLRHILSLRN